MSDAQMVILFLQSNSIQTPPKRAKRPIAKIFIPTFFHGQWYVEEIKEYSDKYKITKQKTSGWYSDEEECEEVVASRNITMLL